MILLKKWCEMNWWQKALLAGGFAALTTGVNAQKIEGFVRDKNTSTPLENI